MCIRDRSCPAQPGPSRGDSGTHGAHGVLIGISGGVSRDTALHSGAGGNTPGPASIGGRRSSPARRVWGALGRGSGTSDRRSGEGTARRSEEGVSRSKAGVDRDRRHSLGSHLSDPTISVVKSRTSPASPIPANPNNTVCSIRVERVALAHLATPVALINSPRPRRSTAKACTLLPPHSTSTNPKTFAKSSATCRTVPDDMLVATRQLSC